ncbi:MAG: glycosyltransferase family 2 protein [Deltaproteobacteria bacterium]|nr:glycosyltransferase family 2 protein [Deltaproteobacteria bacterium]
MQELPLVSIIIPTYNNNPVVCQAIDCSLNQTYGNLEIIVVDDGSTDNTEQLLNEKYKGRIIYVHQKNRGPGSARNTGIRHSSGKYVQFLDADDLLDPDKIRIQITGLRKISGKALSYCDYVRCDMDDVTVAYGRTSPVLQNKSPFDDILMKWETQLCIPMHCFIFDAVFFKECGIAFDESLPANEDWECWMNIFALSPMVDFVDRVLASYRVRENSRCADRLKMRNSHIMAIDMQIKKNRFKRDVVEKLEIRKKQIMHIYRDVRLMARIIKVFPPVVKKLCSEIIPWRIQKNFDLHECFMARD